MEKKENNKLNEISELSQDEKKMLLGGIVEIPTTDPAAGCNSGSGGGCEDGCKGGCKNGCIDGCKETAK